MAVERSFHFSLHIPVADLEMYYQGAARSVVVKSVEGKTVRFPANTLRKFVDRNGVHGEFVMEVDENNKLIDIRRVG